MLTREFSIDCTNGLSVIGHMITMEKSVYIWLSDRTSPNFNMDNLLVAMPTKFDSSPISTSFLCTDMDNDEYTRGLTIRLSRKFGIQLFISNNLSSMFVDCLLEIETTLAKIIDLSNEIVN